jgi:hypothetical protein
MKKTKQTIIPPLNNNDLSVVIDCQFLDSYGTPVKHGSKILIERNYNYTHFNNREALVEWYPKKGMYQFIFIDDAFKSRYDFWGIHSFKVVK